MEKLLANLIDHMHWCNASAIAWLRENPGVPEECRRLLSHILNAERVWIARARRETGDRDTFKVHSLEALPALNDANRADFRKLLDLDLREPVEFRFFEGSPGSSTVETMILHVFSHGFHHVGQMAAIATKAGKRFPNVSYIGFALSR
jgi:uncharacterized damage-inducible protein DinB